MTSVALTIAGSDPSGGAGIQADLKTFQQHGVFGTAVLTLLTVQNTRAVSAVRILDPDFVLAQLDAVLSDIPPVVAKTGALGSAALIEAIAERLPRWGFPVVVDPVMISKHGQALIDADAVDAVRRKLIPHALLITPNMSEAAVLAELEVNDLASMERAAATIALRGVPHVLITGGALETQAVDVLWSEGECHCFATPRVDRPDTHGTGCALSAAITARLARGEAVQAAVQGAKAYVTDGIRTSPRLGGGCGPINFGASVPSFT